MRFLVRLSLLIIVCSAIISLADAQPKKKDKADKKTKKPKKVERIKLEKYLTKYGYLKRGKPGKGRPDPEVKLALRKLQRMAGLKSSGDFDDPSLVDLLSKSRCGVPDIGPTDVARRRRKRYLLQGSRWGKKSITYKIVNYTPDLTNEEVDNTIRDSMAKWAAVSALSFTKVDDDEADILVRFLRGDHGDGYPFDGPGGTLAHAFYPLNNAGISGDAHFDEDETFTLKNPSSGIDLFWVAVHEFGHSLGLDHSNHPDAVMYPYYQGYVENFNLHYDDIQGLQYMYGINSATEAPTVELETATPHVDPTVPSGVPDKCTTTSFDAFAQTAEGYTYAFKGSYFWPVGDTGAWTEALTIKGFWPLLEDNVDAAFYNDSFTYIIKGDKFWKYKNRTPVKPTLYAPLPISDPELNLPAEVIGMDAALRWARNGKIYFFKGDQYWRYDPYKRSLDIGYPRLISGGWQGAVQDNINAAIQWKNERTYFFKGTDYVAIDDSLIKVLTADPPYPRRTANYWMGCSSVYVEGGKIAPVGRSTGFRVSQNAVVILAATLLLTVLA